MSPGAAVELDGAREADGTSPPPEFLAIEQALWRRGLQRVAGVDEVGRGPLAGPVVAAAVILPPGLVIDGVDDSKRLRREVREELVVHIRDRASCFAVGAASTREVERLNILRATHLAMRRALERLREAPDHVIIDGRPVPDLVEEERCTAVVGGDHLVHAVACASIVAKVCRDRLMRSLAARYPGYGWETNVGYATPEHRRALDDLGPTPHHRRTFAPVQLRLDLDPAPAPDA